MKVLSCLVSSNYEVPVLEVCLYYSVSIDFANINTCWRQSTKSTFGTSVLLPKCIQSPCKRSRTIAFIKADHGVLHEPTHFVLFQVFGRELSLFRRFVQLGGSDVAGILLPRPRRLRQTGDPMWPDWAKCCHLGKLFFSLADFLMSYFTIWQNFNDFFFIVPPSATISSHFKENWCSLWLP